MIVWTVKSAVNTPVYHDKSFLSSYHDVDENFNKIMIRNHHFNTLYDVKVKINEKTIGMEIKDAFLGQRSLEKQSSNQKMLNVGLNTISLSIKDKKSQQLISDANITFQVTRPIVDKYDIELKNFIYENGVYKSETNISMLGNWNVQGSVKISENMGCFYIKTSTKD